jgi:hypothetical protein
MPRANIHRDQLFRRPNLLAFLMLLASFSMTEGLMAQPHWPQEITADEGTIIVYQPQPDSLEGNILSGRAAIAIEPANGGDAVFGAMWFTARLDADGDEVTVRDVKVTQVAWPDSKDPGEQRFKALVEGAVPDSGFKISKERLSASLENAKVEQKSLEDLKNEPPNIVFRNELSVLLLFDGEPRFEAIDNSPYERALNTPFAVVENGKDGACYLRSDKFWYKASDPLGPWSPTDNPPSDLVQMMPAPDENTGGPDTPPTIVVATEPTELISTQGKPEWTTLPDSDLLFVKNTETAWIRDISTGDMYVLLSGRWYRAKSQDGPWAFVRSDKLPDSFKEIPPASDIGGLRTSVAGTQEANDAMRDAAIPQTAAIERSKATLEVTYAGTPKFEQIAGTDVSYAVNTDAQVLEINSWYYAVDNGVWFSSDSPNGPWAVADTIPDDEIQKIPPSSPVYNTTYVRIYDSTPSVVYVGYTPGYLWSFPYYGVPVYGTGWYYPPYWGPGIYYPRTPTWGFHVGYNPWTGWNFGVSWTNGFFSFGVGWSQGWGHYPCCGGWYGGGYRGPTFVNNGDININIGNNVNIGNRTEISNRIGNQVGTRDTLDGARLQNRSIYDNAQNRTRRAEPAEARQQLQNARPATDRANNLYTDRNGNVGRINGDSWETRQNNNWATQRDLSTTQNRATTRDNRASIDRSRPSVNYGDLNRSHQARQLGSSREANFRSARQMPRSGGRRR